MSTPRQSSPSEDTALPPMPEATKDAKIVTKHSDKGNGRRTSLGFLRRSKSGEALNGSGNGKHHGFSSGPFGNRKRKEVYRELQLLRESIPKSPPQIPSIVEHSELRNFAGEEQRPDSFALVSQLASDSTATPSSSSEKAASEMNTPLRLRPTAIVLQPRDLSRQLARESPATSESMAHRGRYSYASSSAGTVNSPRRVRRRKDPTPFNILVVGASNSGKTSFISFLCKALALPKGKLPIRTPEELNHPVVASPINNSFVSHYLETEGDSERIGVTIWDSQGLKENIVDLQLREMSSFLESKFEDTFNEEMKVVRSPGARDTHIHCVFLILDPSRLDLNLAVAEAQKSDETNGKSVGPRVVGALDEALDIQVLRTLKGKTTVLPIISKADTVTVAHMNFLKTAISHSLKEIGFDPLEALTMDELDVSDSRITEHAEDAESTTTDTDGEQSGVKLETSHITQSSDAEEGSVKRHPSAKRTSVLSSSDDETYVPLSVLSPDVYTPECVGRKFPWGFADPFNPEHCDFTKLKEAVFQEWRSELKEASREVWYERWRTSRLDGSGKKAAKK